MKLRFKQNDQIGLIFFIAFVLSTILIYQFEERFNEDKWKAQPSWRYEMVDDIIDRDLFINATKDDVIAQLGNPNESYSDGTDYYIYYLGKSANFFKSELEQLTLIFENNRVVEVTVTPRVN